MALGEKLLPVDSDLALRKQTFIINDIPLVIPPTSISVQKEDLVYTWRTLRTRSATKIPTGHGNVSANVSIPFLNSQIVDLHRLVLQLRNSPFCYVENRYLREVICPEQPLSQNMAFAADAIQLSPIAGTSDAWILQLSLTWFNYAPYAPNFLFREDWETNWIQSSGGTSALDIRQSIGWSWNRETKKREFKPCKTDERSAGGNSVRAWSLQNDTYLVAGERTLYELEQLHLGQEFDMLPMPGNMSPSRFVLRPESSRIYVRYINLLQRDALWDNFKIDIEAMLKEAGVPLAGFFGVWKNDEGGKETWGLHRGPTKQEYRLAWHKVMADVRARMLASNNQVNFAFQTFQTVDLPADWSGALQKLAKVVRDKKEMEQSCLGSYDDPDSSNWLTLYDYAGGRKEPFVRYPRRPQLSRPNGFRSPLGYSRVGAGGTSLPDGRVTWSEISSLVTANVETRSPSKDASLYGGRSTHTNTKDRVHWGMDLGGAPKKGSITDLLVYPVRPGVVTVVRRATDGASNVWKYYDSKTGSIGIVDSTDSGRYPNWLATMQKQLGDQSALTNSAKVSLTETYVHLQKAGAYVQDIEDPNVFYFSELKNGGQYIEIRHEGSDPNGSDFEGDTSVYMHLAETYVNVGDRIGFVNTTGSKTRDIDQPIGKVGQTDFFDEQFIKWVFTAGNFSTNKKGSLAVLDPYDPDWIHNTENSRNTAGRADNNKGGYALGGHLHFEYWELESHGPPVDMNPDGGATKAWRAAKTGRVAVDCEISWSLAMDANDYVLKIQESNSDFVEVSKDLVAEEIKDLNSDDFKIDLDKLSEVVEIMNILGEDGWYHYEGSLRLPNVWYKTWVLNFLHTNVQDITDPNVELFYDDNVIVTGVSAGFTNILARLPILGYEFPTLQHMGSIEPTYSFEFSLLDDVPNLQGVPQGGVLLEGMRSVLQKNARMYREIKDSWAVATDTFVTRLFGSYKPDDALFNDKGSAISQVKLLKRTVIDRADNGTVEGNPGLSYVTFEMSETNPYDEERLVNNNPPFVDVEQARKEALQALYGIKIADEYLDSVFPILVGNLANKDFTDVSGTTYGKFDLREFDSADFASEAYKIGYLSPQNASDALGTLGDQGAIAIYDPTHAYEALLRRGIDPDLDVYNMKRVDDGDVLVVPLGAPDLTKEEKQQEMLATLGMMDPLPPSGRKDLLSDYFTGSTTPARTSAGKFGEMPTPGGEGLVRRSYDVRKLLESNSDLDAISRLDLPKIADYWALVNAVIQSASVMLAESADLVQEDKQGYYTVGGLTESKVRSELYDLPVKPQMWRLWQIYQMAIAKDHATWAEWSQTFGFNSPNRDVMAESVLKGNPAWLEWEQQPESKLIKEASNTDLDMVSLAGTHLMNGAVTSSASYLFDVAMENAADMAVSTGKALMLDFSDESSGLTGAQTMDFSFKNQIENIESILVQQYFRNLVPLKSAWLSDLVRFYARESLFGPLVAFLDDPKSGVNALASTHQQLYDNMNSSGYWGFGIGSGFIESAVGAGRPAFLLPKDKSLGSSFQGSTTFQNNITPEDAPKAYSRLQSAVVPGIVASGPLSIGILLFPGAYTFISQGNGNAIVGVNGWGSSFVWENDQNQEKDKVRYFKQILAGLADDILTDPKMLRAFGLDQYRSLFGNQATIQGSEAYPDLMLPEHPYYGDTKDVFPDFYFWNIYDDGQAFKPDIIAAVRESAETVVSNCYDSLVRMQSGEKYDPSADPYVNESADTSEKIVVPTRFNAEGTDGNSASKVNQGHTAIPWYESNASRSAVSKFEGTVSDKQSEAEDAANEVSASSVQTLSVNRDEILKVNPSTARLSVLEGPFGSKGGVQYPRRAATEVYEQLQTHLKSDTKMFGNRAGYLDMEFEENAPAPEVDRLQGTALETPPEYTHLFDKESLKQLAFDSSRDIVSQKMTFRRAYPTFKLFFVEEDEIEDHLISYDDFYSYNGVKEFTVVQSRKYPADTAIITLQNVAGTLDGTKRDAITDLDYFTRKIEKRVPSHASTISGDLVAEGTDKEQPFEAVVLRPGMNVQLRAGYANNPRNLHVLVSGRVVDITWNKTGDLAEIMVQGFGAELVQAIKGTERGEGAGEIYYTTHHLLGSLMLEPELVHFGRWEKGQLFQVGEAKDSRLDFYDYSREGFMGRWKASDSITSFMLKHPNFLFAAAVGLTALSFLPGEGFMAKGAVAGESWLGRIVAKLPLIGKGLKEVVEVPAQIGTAKQLLKTGTTGYWRTVITEAAETGLKRGGLSVLTKAERGALSTIVRTQLYSILRVVKGARFVGEDAIKLALVEKDAALAALSKASTVEEAAEVLAKHSGAIRNLMLTSQWLAKPAPSLLVSPLSFLGWNSAKRLGGNLLTAFWSGQTKVLLAGAIAGAAIDTLVRPALEELYDITVGRVQRWFQTARVTMFLSPQDDNLFCPHPKDYMDLRERSTWEEIREFVIKQGFTAATVSDEIGYTALRWINSDSIFDKRVQPQSAQYQLVSSTIWDVFHEMSLRHPGWVYGTRPYGHAFRYTMFFGVPSQRYWSKPASSEFIQRVNNLSRCLADNNISVDEYRSLYGDSLDGKSLEDIKTEVMDQVVLELNPEGNRGTIIGETNEESNVEIALSETDADDPRIDELVDSYMQARLTAPAIQEYLRGLELRFVPFRNHHLISSSRDLIWNGIMNSENAVYNAVSVTYFDDESNEVDATPTGSELFKAHAFIPENMIRILPLPIYRNCKGYPMAIRYAMGTLMDTMKDMYRGELIVVGNPRLRPWDIAILTDDYNDMVGPIEIEQVVHNFSHETGFITEIKPSAIVIGNEISSWPLIEAAKIWSLAVRDIETKYWGTGVGMSGIDNLMNFLDSQLSPDDKQVLQQRYDTIFGGDLPFIRDLSSDKDLLDSLEPWDEGIQDAVSGIKSAAGGIIGGMTVAGILLGGAIMKKVGGSSRLISAAATGGWLAGAAGAGVIGGALNIPSLKFLLGGVVLFAQCAREEAVIVVPLTKNGVPIVSGLNVQDPSMMFSHFRGNLIRMVKDTFTGVEDLARVWSEYGSGSWAQIGKAWDESAALDASRTLSPDMTGEN